MIKTVSESTNQDSPQSHPCSCAVMGLGCQWTRRNSKCEKQREEPFRYANPERAHQPHRPFLNYRSP
ncbi:hypothetical protein GE061_001904 [Apolygus lucorum]|uniref:Uncharacterized protein n=1 Tax=Apolygus lucorum TaxID=248454 RepID=A0A8S9X3K6_APOLU|nr:hypothetical protein GE061_001904 [Apolygus lucorum]